MASGIYFDYIDKFGKVYESSIVFVLDGVDEPDMSLAKTAVENHFSNFTNAKGLPIKPEINQTCGQSLFPSSSYYYFFAVI